MADQLKRSLGTSTSHNEVPRVESLLGSGFPPTNVPWETTGHCPSIWIPATQAEDLDSHRLLVLVGLLAALGGIWVMNQQMGEIS